MIEIKNLNKTFKNNKLNVINDTSLTLPEKGIITLLGESGSGKTTLLNVIGGLDNVDKGSIK
jgi:ABC-type Fe3+/spermidine/putrescine transport system ATPase subunit